MKSAPVPPTDAPVQEITLDDLRRKTLRIREDVKEEVQEQIVDRRNQIVLIGVVAVVATISIAYYLGSRAGRRALEALAD